jgi:hypothetical protein
MQSTGLTSIVPVFRSRYEREYQELPNCLYWHEYYEQEDGTKKRINGGLCSSVEATMYYTKQGLPLPDWL